AAADYTSDFHANGRLAAGELSLPLAQGLFALDLGRFEAEYLNRFETVCDEIRVAEPAATADHRSGSE
ncbi:MAG TPA: hypothetical protein VH092_33115, partial [Urbifossiella sp.]|nr:hypothetical protein [Urbifossiella sp.]